MPRILQRMVNCPYLLCLNHGVHSSLSPVSRSFGPLKSIAQNDSLDAAGWRTYPELPAACSSVGQSSK